jgi:hypothetical protein
MIINYFESKPGFFWQFGLYYNQDTYGPFFMPLAGFDCKINQKNYIAILVPAYFMYEHKFSTSVYAGFEMELFGETFRLGNSTYPYSFISQLGDKKMTFLTEPRLFLDYYFKENWVIYAKPGFRLFQKYEHFTEGDEVIEDSEFIQGVLRNSFYVEMGLAMRFRYDQEENEEL